MGQDKQQRRPKGNLRDFRKAFELFIYGNGTEEEKEKLKSFLTEEGKEELERLMAGENGKKLAKYLLHDGGFFDLMPTFDTKGHHKEEGELDSIREAALLSKRRKQEMERIEKAAEQFREQFKEQYPEIPSPEELERLLDEIRGLDLNDIQQP